jgi:hypothetical protein
MKNYKVQVWFKFIRDGEVEKDCETHYEIALSKEHAKMIVTEKYGSKYIPYKFEIEEIFMMNKEIIFKLTNPN